MKLSDGLLGGGALLVSAATLIATLSFPRADGPGPELFPRILAIALGVTGVLLLRRAFGSERDEGELWQPTAILKAAAVLALIGGYVAFVQTLGFLISAVAILLAMMLLLGVRLPVALVTSVTTALACVILFEKVLRVPLQQGLLAF